MKPRLLDLFCKAGGCAMGYFNAGFHVVGVDKEPQPRYPFEFHQADAFDYLEKHWREFDVIHASPPCQEYSKSRYLRDMSAQRLGIEPDIKDKLVESTRNILIATGKDWIMENVEWAPMPGAIVLCGSMFGLPLLRHRAFESSILLFMPGNCNHPDGFYSAIGGKIRGHGIYDSGKEYSDKHGRKKRREGYSGKAKGVVAMGIDWMTVNEMCQAIPPAYTEWIGKQFMNTVFE
jgi:DNA (cytosine-5)-methyltransferase 1